MGSYSDQEELDYQQLKKADPTEYVRAPIDKLGYVGLWTRHKLLDSILIGQPVVVGLQDFRTPGRTRVMKFCSFLGMEDFFTFLIILLSWVIDVRLGRLFTVLLAIGFYSSSFFKTLFCLPRPAVPPVQPVDMENKDWALPSNHGIMGVLMPWYVWFYADMHYHMPLWTRILLFTVIITWSASVMISRLYLGVHSPADLVAGGIIGVSILSMYLICDDMLDYYSKAATFAPLQIVFVAGCLLAIHPRAVPETQSFGETIITASVAIGMLIAQSLTVARNRPGGHRALLQDDAYISELHYVQLYAYGLIRLLAGALAVMACRFLLKAFLKRLFLAIYQYADVPVYSYSDSCLVNEQANKYYNEKTYKLPPLAGAILKSHKKTDSISNGFGPAIRDDVCEASTSDLKNGLIKSDHPDFYSLSKSEDEPSPRAKNHREEDHISSAIASLPFDVDIPVRCCLYAFLGWFVAEVAPHIFLLLGI